MRRGNHGKPRGNKVLVIGLALLLVVGAVAGGTFAWFTDTEEAVNTFAVAELFSNPASQFTLWEHKAVDENEDGQYTLSDEEVKDNSYLILPGVNIPKDPTVDIVELKGNGYLYIKVMDSLAEGLSYEIDSTYWEPLAGYAGIWVYKGEYAENHVISADNNSKKTFTVPILKDNQIVVPQEYSSDVESTLTFNAYMAQASYNGSNAAEAWTNTFGTTP